MWQSIIQLFKQSTVCYISVYYCEINFGFCTFILALIMYNKIIRMYFVCLTSNLSKAVHNEVSNLPTAACGCIHSILLLWRWWAAHSPIWTLLQICESDRILLYTTILHICWTENLSIVCDNFSKCNMFKMHYVYWMIIFLNIYLHFVQSVIFLMFTCFTSN